MQRILVETSSFFVGSSYRRCACETTQTTNATIRDTTSPQKSSENNLLYQPATHHPAAHHGSHPAAPAQDRHEQQGNDRSA